MTLKPAIKSDVKLSIKIASIGFVGSELSESYRQRCILHKWLICILAQVSWYVGHVNNLTLRAKTI